MKMVPSQAFIITTVPSPSGVDSNFQVEPSSSKILMVPNRKRRLPSLTMEEKLFRKKLKNREAAQISRDRKKKRMDELENTVTIMSQKIDSLTKQNNSLIVENELLKQQLQDSQTTTTALLETLQAEKCSCGNIARINDQASNAALPSSLSRPAESLRHPLLKGLDGKQAQNLVILRTLLMGFLLSPNCLQSWDQMKISQILATWNGLQRASLKKPLQARRMWNQWWGRHQKSWNPVDLLSKA